MVFKNITNKIQEVIDRMEGYFESTSEYYKLRIFKSLSKVTVSLINLLVYGSLLLFVLLFLSIGAAFWLGTYFEDVFAGFLLVGAFYALILVFMFIFGRKLIERKILGSFSDLFYDEDEEYIDPRLKVEKELDELEYMINKESLRRRQGL